ncbi:MAG: radical SAM protein [Chitinispirillia bacterium]|nr:radical SAM protein [Chitinispirillia bacterium]MCL2268434.1 radical SAM protein [Chitinispirillia bacterium]
MLLDYLEAIAGRLKNNIKVWFCPASFETILAAKMLREKFSVLPAGFCDNDIKKHNKSINSFSGLKILSYDDVLADEASEFFVASPFHSAEIIGGLTLERGVSPSRIINYQPVEKRKTCARFAQNWIVEDKNFVCCCIEEYKPKFDNQNLDVVRGIDYIDKMRNDLIDGRIELPEGCKGCFNNKDVYIYASRNLTSFDFSFKGWCNYKCDYCSANHPDFKGYNNRFALEEYLVEIEKRGILNDIFSVLYAVGEPTLNEKRFSLYRHCEEKQYFLDVFTNCSVFDKALFELAHKAPVIARKSFDAGVPETYAKIKGINCFSKMLENVRRYSQASFFALNPKYLFVPGINDDEENINEFVKICAELNVDIVTPVFSFLDSKYFDSVRAKEMFGFLVEELSNNNIFTANVDTLYSEAYHKTYVESFGQV